MLIYSYTEDTKEFTTVETAEADREATLRLGSFQPLIPANATLLKPPTAGVGKVAVFEGDKWVVKNDFRGKKIIDPETDIVKKVDYIGDLEAGFVFYDEYIKTDEYKEKQKTLIASGLNNLAMKPLDFVNALETMGVGYEEIVAYCNENLKIDKYLRFSDLIIRGDEFINDIMSKFDITSEQMNKIFKEYGG